MLKTALVIMLVLFPAIFGIEEWPEDLHFKYLRSYHGDISCSDNFTECRRRGGERFNLPRVNLMEVKQLNVRGGGGIGEWYAVCRWQTLIRRRRTCPVQRYDAGKTSQMSMVSWRARRKTRRHHKRAYPLHCRFKSCPPQHIITILRGTYLAHPFRESKVSGGVGAETLTSTH